MIGLSDIINLIWVDGDKTTIIYNEKHPHRPITLECDLATAILAPIRYMD